MKKLFGAAFTAALFLFPNSGFCGLGGPVQQSGPIVVGDCAKWISQGYIADAGAACGGSGGSPGGSSGQLQYNNAGSFGGLSTPAYSVIGTGSTTTPAAEQTITLGTPVNLFGSGGGSPTTAIQATGTNANGFLIALQNLSTLGQVGYALFADTANGSNNNFAFLLMNDSAYNGMGQAFTTGPYDVSFGTGNGAFSTGSFGPYPFNVATNGQLTGTFPYGGGVSVSSGSSSTVGPGTVAVSGTVVTGTGTSFLSWFRPGQTITANSETHSIGTVVSDTSMTTDAWTTATSGKTYTLSGIGTTLNVAQNGTVYIGGAVSPLETSTTQGATAVYVSPALVTGAVGGQSFRGADISPNLTSTTNNGTIFNGNWITPHLQPASTVGVSTIRGEYVAPAIQSGAAGTTTNLYGIVSAPQQNSATATVTNMYGIYDVPTQTNTAPITNYAGQAIGTAPTTATNATNLLIGTTTIPTGTFSVYDTDNLTSQFVGPLVVSNASGSTNQFQALGSGSVNAGFTAANGSQSWGFGVRADNSNAFTLRDGTNGVDTVKVATTTGNMTLSGGIAITGTATGPTPAILDNSTKLATTAFVKNGGLTLKTGNAYNGTTTTLTTADAGAMAIFFATPTQTGVLPAANSLRNGDIIAVSSLISNLTLSRAGSDVITLGSSSSLTSLALGVGDNIILESNGSNTWFAVAGTVMLPYSATGGSYAPLASPTFTGTVTAPKIAATGFVSQGVGTAIASASTIAPITGVVHITGTSAIATITPPAPMGSTQGGCLALIADGAWTTTTAGNIFATMTAVAGIPYQACYDGSKWYIK